MKSFKSYIDRNGRLAIPAKVRAKMNLNKGDEVTVKLSDTTLVVSTYHSNIAQTRDILKKYNNVNLQGALQSLRQQDLKDENK